MRNHECLMFAVAAVAIAVGSTNLLAAKEQKKPTETGWQVDVPNETNLKALRRAIEDLAKSFPDKYTKAPEYLKRLDTLEKHPEEAAFRALQREALLANPLLDFDRLLLIKRRGQSVDNKGKSKEDLGLPQNWQGNCVLRRNYENEIAVLSPVRPDGKLTTLFKPEKPVFVGDVDLNFDADKMLISMPDATTGQWHIWEIKADGTGLRQLTPNEVGAQHYDACYLPDGRIIFDSTACNHGVPCVGGSVAVANLYRMDADGKNIRQLCFDQDHDWCPAVLNDGRVMYTRWEYTDTPHYFTRLLFRMNPDGTAQADYYGSNSYWPNSTFYARPIPGHPTKVVAVISGHHGVPRMGELVVFDPARGREEVTGAVQKIPGYGQQVERVVADGLVNSSWPKFLHPYPLSEKYFLVSCKPGPNAPWGIYLVDIFDNMVPILELDGYALLEPVPFRKTPRPPVIPDRVKPDAKFATVYITDIYAGNGLEGVPRGTVRNLRVYEYHYAYRGMGGHISIGIDGPWDVHRILGTVPVNEDGSAAFKVPANTPLAVQPLDENGQAVQVMRSWFTAMPGENVSCAGCHERQNATPSVKPTMASARPPSDIKPWYGPARGFSFKREVQPVLDEYCIGCHDGKNQKIPNLRADQPLYELNGKKGAFKFDGAYAALHPYVRRPGPESDYQLPLPYEWHASTSALVQMLRKGHHNVKLDAEAWDRLVTWIDLNVPDHGTWGEHRAIAADNHELRLQFRAKYANRTEDPEQYSTPPPAPVAFIKPAPANPVPSPLSYKGEGQGEGSSGWLLTAVEAKRRQATAGLPADLKFDLGNGVSLDLVLVPAGEFVMGDPNGAPDERALTRVKIEKPYYLGKFEVSNAQYRLFDATHDSRNVQIYNKDRGNGGLSANTDQQPAIRVSWTDAVAFCDWLSQKTGRKFTLPTEAQWEYACRAGTDTPLWFGNPTTDFSKFANLADKSLAALCVRDSPKWLPRVDEFNDGATGTAPVGKYQPNPWGLYDMHGNAAEWTSSDDHGLKIVRGGSYYDRPDRARSAFRLTFEPYQPVFDVGFRVTCDADGAKSPATTVLAK